MSLGSILLVEPPEDDRPVYAEFLRQNGFSVTDVNSTDAGLSAAQSADLIITGIRVPGSFDGVELVRRLRGDERTRHTPVIVLTACAFEPDQARAFSAGCDVFLPKPCLPETLLAEASRLLDEATRLQARVSGARAKGTAPRRMAKALVGQSNDLVKQTRQTKRKHR